MKRSFLYIDILGFGQMVNDNPEKIDKIFTIFDNLHVFKHSFLQTIVFSDTILVFPKEENIHDRPNHYYVTYLIEYAQELFYKLSMNNIYFKGIITYGHFHFKQMTNFQAYHGNALVETHHDEKILEGFGPYINRELKDDVVIFKRIPFNEKYDYVLLCQSFVNLCKDVKQLPIQIKMLHDTDTYFRIEEDLRFFREIRYIKENHPCDKVRKKHQKVYDIYKTHTENLFVSLEKEDFMPFALNEYFMGNSNPFELLAEKELGEPKPS